MFKKFIYLIAIAAFSVCAYHLVQFYYSPTETAPSNKKEITKKVVVEPVQKKEPEMLYGMVIDSMIVIDDVIKPNQNLSEILTNYNVSFQVIDKLAKLSKDIFDVRKIIANKKYTLICSPDSLKTARCFVYEPNPLEYVVFNLEDSLHVYMGERDVTIAEKNITGEISTSLSDAMVEQGATPTLVNYFADIYGWQIDFFRLQRGDKFKLIFEEKRVGDQLVGYGNIIGAHFEHVGQSYYAIPFDQGEGVDYFDEEGKSLRKAFLKDPLEYTRISSRYSPRRFHPVQKRWKAHLGTDYAAPRGTPIRSVGDGTVIAAGYTRGNGNYVKIKHNGTYTTQYLHMSRFASGIKTGVRVRQGQNIGYVGSTGLATGPHLCYRFWKNGKQVDALKVELPPSQPIFEENVAEYAVTKAKVIQLLDAIEFTEKELMASSKANIGNGSTTNDKAVRMAP